MSYRLHGINHLVRRNPAGNASHCHIRTGNRIHRTDDVSLHTGNLHKSRDRITDKSHESGKRHRCGMTHLIRRSAEKTHRSPCCHRRCCANFCLTSPCSSGETRAMRNHAANASGSVQCLNHLLIRKMLFLLHGRRTAGTTPQEPAVGAATIRFMQALDSATRRALSITEAQNGPQRSPPLSFLS